MSSFDHIPRGMFTPALSRQLLEATSPTFSNNLPVLTSSVNKLIDENTTVLTSSQQLNVDWTRFENHTFFNSARAKVNTAFEVMINQYPFDGTLEDHRNFFSNLN